MKTITFNNLSVKSVEISGSSRDEVDLKFEIYNTRIDDILEEIPSKDILQHLENNNTVNLAYFLERFSLEEIFDEFAGSELREKLAQYLIDK